MVNIPFSCQCKVQHTMAASHGVTSFGIDVSTHAIQTEELVKDNLEICGMCCF